MALFQQMEEVTELVASQMEHRQRVADAETQLIVEREASRRLGEQLILTHGLFPQGHPAIPAIEAFLAAWRDLEEDARVGFFGADHVLQCFRTALRDFCLWLEPYWGPPGDGSTS